jgi:hydrogenase small subunit
MVSLLWLQGGAYSGNTISLLNAEEPSIVDLASGAR